MTTEAELYTLQKLGKPLTCYFCFTKFEPDSSKVRICYIPDPYYGPGHDHKITCLHCWKEQQNKHIWHETTTYNPRYHNSLLFGCDKLINIHMVYGGTANCMLCCRSIDYAKNKNWYGLIDFDLQEYCFNQIYYCFKCVIDASLVSNNTKQQLIDQTYDRIKVRNNFRAYPMIDIQ